MESLAILDTLEIKKTNIVKSVVLKQIGIEREANTFLWEKHSINVSELCERFGKALNLDEEAIESLKFAGLMHDIGKMSIDDTILNKSTELNETDWEEVRKHPIFSFNFLYKTYPEIAQNILYHHEKWDGTGYPNKLKGEEIPFYSRILSIIDAYEAMTSDRTYRKRMDESGALDEIERYAGTQFDPKLAHAFVEESRKQSNH